MSDLRTPSLSTEAPLAPATFTLSASPFVIGRTREANGRVDHPSVAPEHLVLVRRADGWWIASHAAPTQVNGTALRGISQKLAHGDRITLGIGAVLTFDDGVPVPVVSVPRARPIEPVARRRRWRIPEWNVAPRKLLMPVTLLLALALVGGFGWVAWREVTNRPDPSTTLMSEADGILFDSLFTITLDHIERGNILLENGARDAALNEFGTGLSVLTTSRLRKNPYVVERLDELRASIGEVYRSRRVTIPPALVARRGTKALRGQGLASKLSPADFATALDTVMQQFSTRFGRSIVITGRDHAEHLSLYGSGGAVDIRARDLIPEQVSFLIQSARTQGIRVKDFSRDDVLRAQIAAAVKAGLADRAGTGLHLHMDRFADRQDRWTVR